MINSISAEVLDLITQRLLVSDLKNMRLVCSRMNQVATRRLFHSLLLKPTNESIQRWNSVLQDAQLRQLPRSAIIWSFVDVDLRLHNDGQADDYRDDDEEEEEKRKAEFFAAIRSLKALPRLDSVNLRSTADVTGRENMEETEYDLYENINYRADTLQALFTGIKAHNDETEATEIRDLTLRNLQNLPIPELTDTPLFKNVMEKLHGLHLQITYEYNVHGPDHDFEWEERQTFYPHLNEHWLRPIAGNLKRLSLYDVNNWGLFPGQFDTTDLHFPQLEELSLGYYTIAYDDQINWILRCKDLKRLHLHNVQVLSHINIYNTNISTWSVKTDNWRRVPNPEDPDEPINTSEDGDSYFQYDIRWAHFFDRIANELPNLTEITFDYTGGGLDLFDISDRNSLGQNLHMSRYVGFWNGILPNPWPEPDDRDSSGAIEWVGVEVNPHSESIEEDTKAFQQLCKVVEDRRLKTG
ncbi:hypothetical protein C1H76_0597 [Elsinoe australis]|uniref:F-box domain-containing protein n=1 Tax=Elsinoe australis TaxID=40998 RepID=A0A4U7B6N9_9PEZI|nr:hypothetical protein C1H76_0597 [Elsinoe australis]